MELRRSTGADYSSSVGLTLLLLLRLLRRQNWLRSLFQTLRTRQECPGMCSQPNPLPRLVGAVRGTALIYPSKFA